MKKPITLLHTAFNKDRNYGTRTLLVNEGSKEEMAESAFSATNSPYEKAEVVSSEGHCHSLSVGDVVVFEDGSGMIVAGCGFIEASHEELTHLLKVRNQRNESSTENEHSFDLAYDGKEILEHIRAVAEAKANFTAKRATL